MGEVFRRALDEELAEERAPSVAGLVGRAVHDGRRLRRLRLMRTAAGSGFAAAVLSGVVIVVILVGAVPARGPHAGVAGATGAGGPARVVSLHDGNGRLIRLDASDDQRVEAFVQCMVDHGIDMGVYLGTPTPAAPPTVPPSTGPTPSEDESNQTLKLCDQQVPGVYDPDPRNDRPGS